jgi:hypothetical protein
MPLESRTHNVVDDDKVVFVQIVHPVSTFILVTNPVGEVPRANASNLATISMFRSNKVTLGLYLSSNDSAASTSTGITSLLPASSRSLKPSSAL